MADDPRHEAIVSALRKAIKGTRLALFERITPQGDTTSERFNAELHDGTRVVFERRTTAVQRTDAFSRASDGSTLPLPDGEYRLKDGAAFRVVGGQIDFDAIMSDPDGYTPFKEYNAWKEVVAFENPLLSLPDPLSITDVVRFVAADDRSYYAVQQGVGRPYQAYVVVDQVLTPLADGEYPLPGGRRFKVVSGDVHEASLSDLKVYAYESTRLPR
jgi:hypothetical protein